MSASEPNKEIIALKVFRDFFRAFDTLVEEIATYKDKHGVELRDVIENFGAANTLPNLVKSLPPEKLGMLLIAVNDISLMQNDMKNFMTYDKEELLRFHTKLKGLIDKLNNVVR